MSRADLVELAQVAHKSGDAEASRTVHDAKKRTAPEVHGGAGSDYIKSECAGVDRGVWWPCRAAKPTSRLRCVAERATLPAVRRL